MVAAFRILCIVYIQVPRAFNDPGKSLASPFWCAASDPWCAETTSMCFQHRQLAISGCWTLRTSQVSLSGPVVFCGHCCDITVWSRLWMNNQVQSLTRPTNPNAHHVSLLRSKLFQQPCKCFPCYRTRCYKACIHRPRYSHRNRKNAEQYHVYHIRTFDVSKSNPRSASSAAQPTTPVARWAKNQTSVYPKPP